MEDFSDQKIVSVPMPINEVFTDTDIAAHDAVFWLDQTPCLIAAGNGLKQAE